MINTAFCRNEWIPALRSGRYKQMTGNLAARYPTGPKYCCLGVAARRLGAKIAGVHQSRRYENYENVTIDILKFSSKGERDSSSHFLTPVLSDEVGLVSGQYLPVPDSFEGTRYNDEEIKLEYVRDDTLALDLASYNDSGDFNFKMIADLIELVCDAWENEAAKIKTSGPVTMKPTAALLGA